MNCVGALAQDNRAQLLAELQTRIQPLISAKHPNAVVRIENNTLVAEHDTRDWLVYGAPFYNEFDKEPHQERGPNHNGFRLVIQIRDGVPSIQEMLPRTQQMPYWKTHFRALPLNVLTPESKLSAAIKNEALAEYPDVPRGHWTYRVTQQLSDAGVMEELPIYNGTQKARTGYEFAIATARLLSGIVGPDSMWFNTQLPALPADASAEMKSQRLSQEFRIRENRRVIEQCLTITFQALPNHWKAKIQHEMHWESIQALVREFSGEIARLGLKVSPPANTIKGDNIQHQHLWVELSSGTRTDAALLDKMKSALDDFAIEKYQAAIQTLKEK